MAKYVIVMEAVVEARTDDEAKRQAALIKQGLANPMLKTMLAAQGVNVVEHRVSSTPRKAG